MPRCPHCEESIPGGLSRCPECDGPLRRKKRPAPGSALPAIPKSRSKSKSGAKPRREPPASRSNTPLIIGLGLGTALLLMVGLFFLLKGKSETPKENVAASTPLEDRQQTRNRLKQLGLAMHNYHDVYVQFPPGGIYNAQGKAFHGWQTSILPFMDQAPLYKKIDFNLPWDHPKNVANFQHELPMYCRESEEPRKNDQGLGLSHWAASQYLMSQNSSMKIHDVTDGTSNTLLLGEVAGDFKPWGHPANWRDPAQGINKGPQSFGNPNEKGGFFLFGDGTVHFISENVDPEVLHRLADYKDGKPPGQF